MSPRKAAPQIVPGDFAYMVAVEIQTSMDDLGISGAELARRIDRSQDYVATRLRKEAAFSLSDVDVIADALGTSPQSIINRASKSLM